MLLMSLLTGEKTNPAINVTLYLGHANSLTAQLLTSLIAHVKIDARYLVQKKFS